jgi:hypothetical protein
MSVENRDYIKNNWMTLANLIILLTLVFNVGKWQNGVDKDIDSLKEHSVNETLHMPLERKIQVFVPRVELDARLKNMEVMLKRIDNKIN